MLHHLRDTALKVEEDDANMAKVIKEELLAQLNNKYDSNRTMPLMRTATLLNPRHKGKFEVVISLNMLYCS